MGSVKLRRTSGVELWFSLDVVLAAIPIIKGADLGSLDMGDIAHSPEHDLFVALFSHYNKHIRPIAYHGEITSVFFELSLFNVLSFDNKNQQIRTNTEVIQKWQDHYLTWDPKDYNGTEVIRIPYTDIWYPDIIMQNTYAADYMGSILNTNAIVYYTGEVELLSHGIFDSICSVDVQYYPFDQQVCELVFASWTYDKNQIILLEGPADLSQFKQNPEFFLENFWSAYADRANPCCKYPVSTISYFVQLQRRTIFSLFFFIMPGILINVCALMVFSLPTESGEKIGLGINSMLAMMVFLMAMTENLPPTEKLPLAGIYYGACITMIALNITFSVSVLNLNVMGMRGYQVPEFVKMLILFLAKVIVVRIPRVVRESWKLDEEPSDTQLTQVEPLTKDGSLVKVFTVDTQKQIPQPNPPTLINGILNNNELDYTTFKDPFQKRALSALESMTSILSREETEGDKHSKKQSLIEEWKFVSRVFDRLLFLSFTFACFVFNVVILTSSPFRERFSFCPLGEGLCDEMTFEEIVALTLHAAANAHVPGTGGGDHWGGGGGHGGDHGGGDGGGHGGDGGGHGAGGGGGHGRGHGGGH